MVRECIRCNLEMKKARINTGAVFTVEELKKGYSTKDSYIDSYVCPKCGHIELVAQKPEVFLK